MCLKIRENTFLTLAQSPTACSHGYNNKRIQRFSRHFIVSGQKGIPLLLDKHNHKYKTHPRIYRTAFIKLLIAVGMQLSILIKKKIKCSSYIRKSRRDRLQSHTLKKNYGTHVIKLDIAPVAFPLGQHLFISASNNMFYRHSQ
jgi:hypothetical protein